MQFYFLINSAQIFATSQYKYFNWKIKSISVYLKFSEILGIYFKILIDNCNSGRKGMRPNAAKCDMFFNVLGIFYSTGNHLRGARRWRHFSAGNSCNTRFDGFWRFSRGIFEFSFDWNSEFMHLNLALSLQGTETQDVSPNLEYRTLLRKFRKTLNENVVLKKRNQTKFRTIKILRNSLNYFKQKSNRLAHILREAIVRPKDLSVRF